MEQVDARVIVNRQLQGDYYVLVVDAPSVAENARPGQFAHVRIPHLSEGILRRPFSIYSAENGRVGFIYKVVGKGTRKLACLSENEILNIIGPLGRGFTLQIPSGVRPILVAGGYGIAPLTFLARSLERKGSVCIGGKSRLDILCADELASLGWQVFISTEDGSLGERGLVTRVFGRVLEEFGKGVYVYACGPLGMLKAVSEICRQESIPAEVSIDRHMCCGVGACWTCVVPVKSGGDWEYARVCKEGPVFSADSIIWDRIR